MSGPYQGDSGAAGQPSPDYSGQPYAQGGQQPYGYAPVATSGRATASLVLGIVGLLFLGLLTGIPAIVLGVSARREIDASGGRVGGRGLAVAGLVLGIIATIWSVLLIVLVLGTAISFRSYS